MSVTFNQYLRYKYLLNIRYDVLIFNSYQHSWKCLVCQSVCQCSKISKYASIATKIIHHIPFYFRIFTKMECVVFIVCKYTQKISDALWYMLYICRKFNELIQFPLCLRIKTEMHSAAPEFNFYHEPPWAYISLMILHYFKKYECDMRH